MLPVLRTVFFAVCLAGLGACGSSPTPEDGSESPSAACTLVEDGFGPDGSAWVPAEVVVDGLEVPWGIAFVGEGAMLVTERPGRIRLVEGGTLVPEPVATVEAAAEGEGGLLGIAAHPDFAANRLFYVYYTSEQDGTPVNRVERWTLSSDRRRAARDRVVLDGIPASRFHNGGRLRFGPDGMLYGGTGDAQEPELAQDRSSLAGKLLRLTPDGAVPPDNPFPDSPVYLTGIRNTQGFAWPNDTTVWLTDHGPTGEMGRTGHDEVNVTSAGDNLGWPTIYGCETNDAMVTPSLTWREAVPPGGAAISRGAALPDWQGDLIVGTLGSRHLHRVAFDDESPRRVERHAVYLRGGPPDGYGRLREVIAGPDGTLYVTTSNCDGRGTCPPEGDVILRIAP